MMKYALLLIDIQNDFCPGGALGVIEGDRIIPGLNGLMAKYRNHLARIVATQDWHPADHVSFAQTHGLPLLFRIEVAGRLQTLWPAHCVAGTPGADLHPSLERRHVDLILRKGQRPDLDSYSAFLENDQQTATGLEGYLKSLGIGALFVAGLALDYCVLNTALDAVRLDFATTVIEDLTRAVDNSAPALELTRQRLRQGGVYLTQSRELAGMFS